jgi:hypothetical protein
MHRRNTMTISVTNVMNFSSTDFGTTSAIASLRKSRDRMFSRIAEGVFDAVSENTDFFSEDDE